MQKAIYKSFLCYFFNKNVFTENEELFKFFEKVFHEIFCKFLFIENIVRMVKEARTEKIFILLKC